MKFSNLLTRYRTNAGLSKKELAQRSYVSASYIGNLENQHDKPPPMPTCENIAKALDLSHDEKEQFYKIAYYERNAKKDIGYKKELGHKSDNLNIEKTNVSDLKKVPIISFVQASNWSEAFDPYAVGDAHDFIYINHKGGEMTYSVIVKGDCMSPEFLNGDKILVDPEQIVENGQYALVKDLTNNNVTFKKVNFTDDGGAILQPLNQKYQPIFLDSNKKYKIIGKVIGLFKEF